MFNETYQILIAVGLLLAAVDIVVLGFSTFFLTIVGLACISSGVLILLGIIPDSILSLSLAIGLLSAAFVLLLYRPLKALQQQKSAPPQQVQSDLIGMRFVLEQRLSPTTPIKYHYSGIEWRLMSEQDLDAGTRVKVTRVEVGIMYVVAELPNGLSKESNNNKD